MKKALVWIITVTMIVGLLLLVACESNPNGENTYSLKTEENGMEVTYTISFKSNGNVVMTKISPMESVTYEGKYELKGKDEYEIYITGMSGEGTIPASLSKMKVSVSGTTFSFTKSTTGDSTSTEEPKRPVTKAQENDSGNYNEKPITQTQGEEESSGQTSEQTIEPTTDPTTPTSTICTHPTSEIVIENSVEPTCGQDGHTGKIYCKKCGTVLQEETVLPMTGNHPQESIVTEDTVEPTCMAEGHTGKKYCGVCQTVLVPETVLGVIDHTIVNKVCTMCHEVFPYGTYTKTEIIFEYDDGNGNTEQKTVTYSLLLHADSAYSLKKTETYRQELAVNAEKQNEYTQVTFVSSAETIDALEANGYEALSEYSFRKITEQNGVVTVETIVLNEPEYQNDPHCTGTYTKIVVQETTEKAGTYVFQASTNVVAADSRRYVLDLEHDTFVAVEGEEKVNKFKRYGEDEEIILYYGDYDGVTLNTLAITLLARDHEELASDGYEIVWYKDGFPTDAIDVPSSPFSMDEDHVYTMELSPSDGYVMIKVIGDGTTYLYFAREDLAADCTTADDYSALLSLSSNYLYAVQEQYVLTQTPKVATIVYVLAENVEIEKYLGETYTIESYSGYTVWYTETDEYAENQVIDVTGNLTLYPVRYTITYWKNGYFVTEVSTTKPDVTGDEKSGYANEGFLLNGVGIELVDLPDSGDLTILCYYEKVTVENEPTEEKAGNYLMETYIGETYSSNSDQVIPALNDTDYTLTVVEASLLAAGEKTYESNVYGTYTVPIDALTTQTFTYENKEYVITLGESNTAVLSIDGTEYDVTTSVDNDTLVMSMTDNDVNEVALYRVSLTGDYFMIDAANAVLPASDGISLETYKSIESTNYLFVQSRGYGFYSEGTDEYIIASEFVYENQCYYMILPETTYYVSFVSGKVLYSETEGVVPTCSVVDFDDHVGESVYMVTADTLTLSANQEFTYTHGTTVEGKYRTDNIANNIVLYREENTQTQITYRYSIVNGNPTVTKDE